MEKSTSTKRYNFNLEEARLARKESEKRLDKIQKHSRKETEKYLDRLNLWCYQEILKFCNMSGATFKKRIGGQRVFQDLMKSKYLIQLFSPLPFFSNGVFVSGKKMTRKAIEKNIAMFFGKDLENNIIGLAKRKGFEGKDQQEDMGQEARANVLKTIERSLYDPEKGGNWITYYRAVIFNSIVDIIREHYRKPLPLEAVSEETLDPRDIGEGMMEKIDLELRIKITKKNLLSLKEKDRNLLVWAAAKDLSTQSISNILGIENEVIEEWVKGAEEIIREKSDIDIRVSLHRARKSLGKKV